MPGEGVERSCNAAQYSTVQCSAVQTAGKSMARCTHARTHCMYCTCACAYVYERKGSKRDRSAPGVFVRWRGGEGIWRWRGEVSDRRVYGASRVGWSQEVGYKQRGRKERREGEGAADLSLPLHSLPPEVEWVVSNSCVVVCLLLRHWLGLLDGSLSGCMAVAWEWVDVMRHCT